MKTCHLGNNVFFLTKKVLQSSFALFLISITLLCCCQVFFFAVIIFPLPLLSYKNKLE